MLKKLTMQEVRAFRNSVYSYFKKHRRSLPWRSTKDPYHILVSEVMLQQTQVDRTVPKYQEFIHAFPTVRKLASASPRAVLSVWQGMGYNRRALNLQRCAQHIVQKHHGKVPTSYEDLVALPGIGPYTANAIRAFAFDEPSVLIETNVRSVFLHHFFPGKRAVPDSALLPLIEQALDVKHPRRWYSALMDYGSYLKKQMPNPSRRSAHHVRQARFVGSVRQARGAIMKALLQHESLSMPGLERQVPIEKERLMQALDALLRENIVRKARGNYSLVE